jgi:hypothetical protein
MSPRASLDGALTAYNPTGALFETFQTRSGTGFQQAVDKTAVQSEAAARCEIRRMGRRRGAD